MPAASPVTAIFTIADAYPSLSFERPLFFAVADTDSNDDSKEGALFALDKCIAKLTEKQQSLIKERYTPGNTLEQYADRSGKSSVSLRVALHRVRQFLKRCVEETLREETA